MSSERRRAQVSAGELAYVDLGEGPAVLLIHGFPTSSYLWRREIPLLSARMRVIAPDLLGYGDSDRPEGADLTERAQTRYVGELLEALGIDELAVVGHDIGGGVAQLLTLDGRARVRSLVLLDSVCFDAWPIESVKMLQGVTPAQLTEEFVEAVVRVTFDLGIQHEGRLTERDLDAYVEPWRREPAAFLRAVRGITGEGLAGRDDELRALDIPLLVVWGEDDPFLPSELGERIGDLVDGSTVALLPGCSHFVNEDAPQSVGPLVSEYLRSRYLHETHGHHHGPVPVFLERPPGAFFDTGLDGGGD